MQNRKKEKASTSTPKYSSMGDRRGESKEKDAQEQIDVYEVEKRRINPRPLRNKE
jgi:hypothetical protein